MNKALVKLAILTLVLMPQAVFALGVSPSNINLEKVHQGERFERAYTIFVDDTTSATTYGVELYPIDENGDERGATEQDFVGFDLGQRKLNVPIGSTSGIFTFVLDTSEISLGKYAYRMRFKPVVSQASGGGNQVVLAISPKIMFEVIEPVASDQLQTEVVSEDNTQEVVDGSRLTVLHVFFLLGAIAIVVWAGLLLFYRC